MTKFNELTGKTLTALKGADTGNDTILFVCDDGSRYQLWHEQECCESVSINEIIGDVADLLNSPLLLAEEVNNLEPPKDHTPSNDSETWTFYRLTTIKGTVVIRWLGRSNGYYSESVTFEKVG